MNARTDTSLYRHSSKLFVVFLALTLISIVAFALFYALAIWFRRDAQVHARWMVCTVFPLVTPVTDRLIGAHFQPVIGLVPQIDGSPILPAAGFLLADLVLVALIAWDWRANRRLGVFPVALGALLAYHFGALTLHRVALERVLRLVPRLAVALKLSSRRPSARVRARPTRR